MELELRPIDASNLDAVEHLEVFDHQKQYIAANKISLATSMSEENRDVARPFAICAGDSIIGFAMFAFDLTFPDPRDRYWLWRFMIDKDHQGKGYGSAALEAILAYFRIHGANHILLSTKETNTPALSLYHKYGFAETGEMNDDEIVLRLNLLHSK